jgi:hypothetical protein
MRAAASTGNRDGPTAYAARREKGLPFPASTAGKPDPAFFDLARELE